MRFEALATSAALGTSNRPIGVQDLPDDVAAVLPGGESATVLLDAAASFALALRATVPDGPTTPLALPPRTRPEAPTAFVALLRRVRASGALRQTLQPQALRMLAERGLTLPPDLARELLDEAGLPGSPRALLGAVLDDRLWALVRLDSALARRLERSGASAQPLDAATWDDGTLAQRVAHLAAVRATDAAAGLALVQGLAWAKETAEARAQFLQALRIGLSLADEPLLERALDDRAKTVRETAASLLAELRGSAFLARAEALAAAHLARRTRLLRGPLTVAGGVPRSDATTRDRYPAEEPDSAAQGRARLNHVVSLVPSDRWPALLGATSAELAAGPVECDGEAHSLRLAWTVAARRWRDLDLARVLLDAGPDESASLVPLLPAAERTRHLTRLLLASPDAHQPLESLLPQRMDAALTAGLLDVLDAWVRGPNHARFQLPRLVALVARRGDLTDAPAVVERLRRTAGRVPDDETSLRRAFADAGECLQLRAALAEALARNPVLTTIADDEEALT